MTRSFSMRSSLVLLMVVLSLLPMFVIALDWGRLINIHVLALAVVIVALVLDDRDAPGSVFGLRNWWLRAAILLGVFLYLTTWSIRHCCTDALNTTKQGWPASTN